MWNPPLVWFCPLLSRHGYQNQKAHAATSRASSRQRCSRPLNPAHGASLETCSRPLNQFRVETSLNHCAPSDLASIGKSLWDSLEDPCERAVFICPHAGIRFSLASLLIYTLSFTIVRASLDAIILTTAGSLDFSRLDAQHVLQALFACFIGAACPSKRLACIVSVPTLPNIRVPGPASSFCRTFPFRFHGAKAERSAIHHFPQTRAKTKTREQIEAACFLQGWVYGKFTVFLL